MTYREKVYKLLDEMEPGQRIELDPGHITYNMFIEEVKRYIDNCNYEHGIEFNKDYTVLKRQHLD